MKSKYKYFRKIIPILKEAAKPLRQHYGKIEATHSKSTQHKKAVDVVTKLDIETEKLIKARLQRIYPAIGFVGEETGGNRRAKRFWLCDPIDGTAHFIRGIPFYSIMLALIEDGQVTLGVIYNVTLDEIYYAEKNCGAVCNGKKIQVSKRNLRTGYIGYESNQRIAANHKLMHSIYKKTIMLKTVSAGFELALVAAGKLDARLQVDPFGQDFDFAPGSLLVEEAGGIVTNIGSKEYDYRNTNFIAANPTIYKQLTKGRNALFPSSE
jgi:myo-inositol-1(or 4)-monophosphatase